MEIFFNGRSMTIKFHILNVDDILQSWGGTEKSDNLNPTIYGEIGKTNKVKLFKHMTEKMYNEMYKRYCGSFCYITTSEWSSD